MAEWKKIITSGSQAELAGVTGSLSGSGIGITGITTANLTGTITNAQLAGSITNAKLSNSTISGKALGTNLDDLTVDDSTITLDSGTTYNGSSAVEISIKDAGVTLAKQANMAADRIQGRANGAGSGAPTALTATQVRTIINVEDAADVTDTTNVTSAGALMDSELAEIATVKALTKADISGSITAASSSFSTRVTTNEAKLDGIEASADVTDTTNVTSAGALMDSELSEIATVKALTKAGISGSFTAVSASIATDIAAASGDITSVQDGDGLTGGANSGDVTLAVGAGTGITVNTNDVAITATQTGISSLKHNSLIIGGNSQNNTIDFGTDDVILFDTDNTERMRVDAAGVDITGALTVTGDLTVNGDVTTVRTTNATIEDKFILLNSGSASGDGGIIVNTEGTSSGSAFVYDDSESRWGVQQGTKLGDTAVVSVPDGHASIVVTSDVSAHQKNGNIRVEGSEIFIYVE